ncbi:MAG: LTA synthase family protein [Lachnospiraceae bacterium]|nr:LTA synthase family protein [Lachnospiraceae bacterium]
MIGYIVGLKIIKYYKDIWAIIYVAFVDFLMIDAQAIRDIRLDGNEATVFFNILVFFVLLYVIYLICARKTICIIISQLCVALLSAVNYYLYNFRGRTLYISDIKSLNTVFNVAQQYDLKIDKDLFIHLLCLFVISILTFEMFDKKKCIHSKRNTLCQILFCIAGSVIMFNNTMLSFFGYHVYWWDNSSHNGFLLGLILQMENYGIKTSKNYSDTISNEINQYIKAENNNDNPDIIIIMNESFSDLSVIHSFNTNQDYMPFYHSMQNNCIKGNLYVSVRGGNTANTEYEFLTGDSMAFYKYGQVVYNSYLNHSVLSNVSHLKNNNYSLASFHPYFKSGWNRERVYNNLGFEQNTFLEDLWSTNEEIVNLRYYASDWYTYDKLFEIYNSMPEEKQRFIFCVTMQNHAGYDDEDWIPQQQIGLLGKDEDNYPLTSQYLSLIYESDKALEHLIDLYQKLDRKVIICFFGDHQPGIENSFYEELYGKKMENLTLEELQKGYITPFLIWANYDIESDYVDKISANYLFAYMCRATGIPMSAFDNYLMDLYSKYPVINSVGVIDSKDNYYTADEINDITDIQIYYDIIYNQIIDKNTAAEFFE